MKKTNLFLLLLTTTLFFSCNENKKAVKTIAYEYAKYTSNYQVKEASRYATEETRNTTLVMAEQLIQSVGEEYIKSDTPAQVEITSVEIIDDTIAYAIYHKTTPIKNFSDTLWLRQRNGEWLVHVPLPIVHQSKKKAPIMGSHGQEIKKLKPITDDTSYLKKS